MLVETVDKGGACWWKVLTNDMHAVWKWLTASVYTG